MAYMDYIEYKGYIKQWEIVETVWELQDAGASDKDIYDFICEEWHRVENGTDLEDLFCYLYDSRYSFSCRQGIAKQLKKQLKKQIDSDGYITIYRGFNKYSRENGNSFTLSKKVAIKFSNRWGEDEGYVNKYQIHIDDVVAFITDRTEAEIVADPDDVIFLETLK